MKLHYLHQTSVSLKDFANYMGYSVKFISMAIDEGKIKTCSKHGDELMIDNLYLAEKELKAFLETVKKVMIDKFDDLEKQGLKEMTMNDIFIFDSKYFYEGLTDYNQMAYKQQIQKKIDRYNNARLDLISTLGSIIYRNNLY